MRHSVYVFFVLTHFIVKILFFTNRLSTHRLLFVFSTVISYLPVELQTEDFTYLTHIKTIMIYIH